MAKRQMDTFANYFFAGHELTPLPACLSTKRIADLANPCGHNAPLQPPGSESAPPGRCPTALSRWKARVLTADSGLFCCTY